MKRCSWLMVTIVTLVVTAVVLTQVRRAAAKHAARSAPRRVELRTHARAFDPWASTAAVRWRHCEPTHWRALMLQH